MHHSLLLAFIHLLLESMELEKQVCFSLAVEDMKGPSGIAYVFVPDKDESMLQLAQVIEEALGMKQNPCT